MSYAKNAPTNLCAMVGSICFLKKTIGEAAGQLINFTSAVYWMHVWVEKRRKTFKESVRKDIEVEFEQFVKMIGRELVSIDVHNVWMMIFPTTLSW